MNAIVLDGHLKSALACVRSLGKQDIPVAVGALRGTAMSLHSGYASNAFVYPNPLNNRSGFVKAVERAAERLGGKPLVYAMSDATLLPLFAERERLGERLTLVFPEEHSLDIAFDKAATCALAKGSGIPTIPTLEPHTTADVRELAKTLTYPAVIKGRRSVVWSENGGLFGSASFVMDAGDLVSSFERFVEQYGEAPLIQPFIDGKEYGVDMLVFRGRPYAMVTHERLRSLSPTGGASVLKRTMVPGGLAHTLEEYARTLAVKLSWTGPLMAEFKVDRKTGAPYLMELNGRFWGSLPLSIAAGVDVPYLFYRASMYQEIPQHPVLAEPFVASRHFLGDILHLLRVLCARSPMRSFVYPSRLRALREFFTVPSRVRADVWSFDDPKPSIMELVDGIKKVLWR